MLCFDFVCPEVLQAGQESFLVVVQVPMDDQLQDMLLYVRPEYQNHFFLLGISLLVLVHILLVEHHRYANYVLR
jgi:hypothetical protein